MKETLKKKWKSLESNQIESMQSMKYYSKNHMYRNIYLLHVVHSTLTNNITTPTITVCKKIYFVIHSYFEKKVRLSYN